MWRIRITRSPALMVSVLLLGLVGCGSGSPTSHDIERQADEILHAACNTLAAAEKLSFHARNTTDEMLDSGQIVQFSSEHAVTFRRPNKLFGDGSSDSGRERLWYDGRTLTVLALDRNCYASVDVPPTVEQMFDFIFEEYDITVPLADLVFKDPYETLVANVERGEYLGQDEVDGHLCHHLAFQQDLVDWQVWIDAGETAVPRKVVITHKREPGHPQFVAILDQWDLNPNLSDELFQCKLPANAKRMEMGELDLRE